MFSFIRVAMITVSFHSNKNPKTTTKRGLEKNGSEIKSPYDSCRGPEFRVKFQTPRSGGPQPPPVPEIQCPLLSPINGGTTSRNLLVSSFSFLPTLLLGLSWVPSLASRWIHSLSLLGEAHKLTTGLSPTFPSSHKANSLSFFNLCSSHLPVCTHVNMYAYLHTTYTHAHNTHTLFLSLSHHIHFAIFQSIIYIRYIV